MSADDAVSRRIKAAGHRSIAAGQIGNAYTGDVLPAEALHAPEKVTAAPGTSNLPPAALCLGREEELAWLRHILTDQREGAITQSGTAHGLGGIGKSTLALHYAHRYRGEYTLIWWINATSPDSIEQSLTGITRRLVPVWAATSAREAQVAWAMQWLSWHRGWLLVYDNAEDPADLERYTGSLNSGHHLVTSRRSRGWPDGAATLLLGTLDPDDAVNVLCTLAFRDATPTLRQRTDARALAADLGYLPLALKQAGSYLNRNRGITLDAYRRSLGTKLHKADDGISAERTIARIWHLTLHILASRDPLAVDVLYTAAWLAPDNVPHALLAPHGTDPDDLAEAIGTLASYSMATDTGTTLSIHRLVQTVLRTPQDLSDHRPHEGRERAEQALVRHLAPPPGQETTTEGQWDALIPHLIALAANTPPGHHSDPLIDAYECAAYRLHQQGHTTPTIPLWEVTLSHRERLLGDTHPDTLTSRHHLAYVYGAAGNLRRAIPLYEATLAQREQVLGDTHPDTLTSRHHLATTYRGQQAVWTRRSPCWRPPWLSANRCWATDTPTP
ncbi:hypothetical protein J2Z21_005451 [Streptomyces griseochromogenes]|uniref:NB-ARC domain-containing protein n=1 Tax=Streptomyces griseochromogenes TaxID=68214 RepID=A0A1B1B5Q5_9ACTN|nr:tetratricopeptide repeat protein [Streptomyces griseochromogenes]ANP54158.1 hypothetical protein AVL59_35415 [Streptomyces griseochromogenes]MBP2052468.1 hypothetical protein [Streptomyces griseochromogenes]